MKKLFKNLDEMTTEELKQKVKELRMNVTLLVILLISFAVFAAFLR
jgi:hypothetical protein